MSEHTAEDDMVAIEPEKGPDFAFKVPVLQPMMRVEAAPDGKVLMYRGHAKNTRDETTPVVFRVMLPPGANLWEIRVGVQMTHYTSFGELPDEER